LKNEKTDAAALEDQIIPEGQRNEQLTSIAGAMRRKGCDQEAIFAALISINQRRCKPPLSYEELHKIAESIANYSPQPQEGSVLADDHHETIALAFEAASPKKHRHYAGTWVVLRHKKYFILDEQELDKDIRRFAKTFKVRKKIRTDNGSAWRNEKLRVTPQSVHGIIKAMAALEDVRLSLKVVSPSWLSETPPEDDDDTNFDPSAPLREPDNPVGRQHDKKPNPERVLPLKNCLLDVSGNEPKVMELTDDYFTLNYLPIVYDPKAKCPKWKEFLGQIFQTKRLSSDKTEWTAEADDFVEVYENVPDELSISTLQEYVGLLLTPITKYQKILGIVGPKRSGKGTIGRIIRALVGKDNVASPTLIGLTNEHGLQGLYHKTVALVSDASISGGNADTLRAVERLKSITGEDSQQINPKCKAHFEVDRLRVRFVIMSNELQKLTDPTGAMASRFADFHSLRHTAGTLLASSGVHPKVAQSLMRHSDINLTMSLYTHTLRGQESEAVAMLPDLAVSARASEQASGTDGESLRAYKPAYKKLAKTTTTPLQTTIKDKHNIFPYSYLCKNRAFLLFALTEITKTSLSVFETISYTQTEQSFIAL
jgi:putative DNA primase/helicase